MRHTLRLVLCCALAASSLGCIAVAGPQEECPCPSSLVPQATITVAGLPTGECG